MKRLAYAAMLALAAGIMAVPAVASSHEGEEGKFSVHGEVRMRWEYLSNFLDFQDHQSSGDIDDDDFDFWPYRVRLGAKGQFSRNVFGYIELQTANVLGVNGNDLPNEDGPLRQLDDTDFIDENEADLYQGFIHIKNIGDTKLSIRVGRAEHAFGTELQMGDIDFYGGLFFDGARLMWDYEKFDLDVFAYRIDEDNDFTCCGFRGDDNDDFYGVTASIDLTENGQELDPYLLWYRSGEFGGPNIYTMGARYGRFVESQEDVEDLFIDWNVEAAFQTGDFDQTGPGPVSIDQSGSIFEGWIGFNFNHGDSRSRVHIGGFMSSGDDDPTDSDIDQWFTLFPDQHAWNRLGDLDAFGIDTDFGDAITGDLNSFDQNSDGIGNLTDYNVGYTYISANNTHMFMAALHQLMVTEETDAGLGGALEDEIGLEVDLKYNYNYSANLSFQVGVAQLLAGDLMDLVAQDEFGEDADDVMRVWGQARLRW